MFEVRLTLNKYGLCDLGGGGSRRLVVGIFVSNFGYDGRRERIETGSETGNVLQSLGRSRSLACRRISLELIPKETPRGRFACVNWSDPITAISRWGTNTVN